MSKVFIPNKTKQTKIESCLEYDLEHHTKYNKLTILEYDGINEYGEHAVTCQCECGNIKYNMTYRYIRKGDTKTCGNCIYGDIQNDIKNKTKYGRLTVIEYVKPESQVRSVKHYVICQCECGNKEKLLYSNIKYKNITHCSKCDGCYKIKTEIEEHIKNKTKFGHLVILKYDHKETKKSTNHFVLCKCDCGNEKILKYSNLKQNRIKHCGCNNHRRYVLKHPCLNRDKKVRASFNKNKICKVCGQKECKYPDLCNSGLMHSKSENLIKLGFDFSSYGTEKINDEYEKFKDRLYDLYYNKEYSIIDFMKIFGIKSEYTFTIIFNKFNIPRRSSSESQLKALKNNKGHKPQKSNMYKYGYHTSWEGVECFYRSSYKLDYMNELDGKKISYHIEPFRIEYYNTQKERNAIAIPDFYLPETNTIVEVKSEYTYNKQEMIDKSEKYKEMGYNFILLLEHKEYTYCV